MFFIFVILSIYTDSQTPLCFSSFLLLYTCTRVHHFREFRFRLSGRENDQCFFFFISFFFRLSFRATGTAQSSRGRISSTCAHSRSVAHNYSCTHFSLIACLKYSGENHVLTAIFSPFFHLFGGSCLENGIFVV